MSPNDHHPMCSTWERFRVHRHIDIEYWCWSILDIKYFWQSLHPHLGFLLLFGHNLSPQSSVSPLSVRSLQIHVLSTANWKNFIRDDRSLSQFLQNINICTPNALPVLAYRAYWHPHPLYALLSFSRTGNAPMYIKSSFCVSDKPLPCLSDRVNVLLVEPVQWHRSTYVYNDNSIKSIFNHWQLLVSGSLPRSHPATATAAANEPWKWVLGRCHQAIWPSDKLSSCERVGQWTGSHLGKDCNPWGWLF